MQRRHRNNRKLQCCHFGNGQQQWSHAASFFYTVPTELNGVLNFCSEIVQSSGHTGGHDLASLAAMIWPHWRPWSGLTGGHDLATLAAMIWPHWRPWSGLTGGQQSRTVTAMSRPHWRPWLASLAVISPVQRRRWAGRTVGHDWTRWRLSVPYSDGDEQAILAANRPYCQYGLDGRMIMIKAYLDRPWS